MDILGGRAVVALGNHELLPALDDVDAEINRLEGIRLQLVARVEESGTAQDLGARDAVDLLAFRHRRDRTDVHREVRLARTLPKYAAVADAITAGAIRTAQATGIVAELERVRARVPVDDLDVAETQLVGLAAHLAPTDLRAAAKRICNLIDSDGPEPDERKAYDRESLTLTTADNGVKLKGFLANENAELLRAVIHAGARPHKTTDGEHDPRPRDKRQADALTTALTLAANAWDTNTATPDAPAGSPVPGHGAKANITVTIDLDDLRSATANALGQTVYSDDLSAATIRRLACDANIIPLVLGSNSEPLDVGRKERLVTKSIRQALIARDRGCVICGAPPVMCDAHHLTPWQDGGVTAVWNLALACRRHHTDVHNGRWTITITNGEVHVARPDWATPPRPTTSTAPTTPAGPPSPATPAHPPSPAITSPASPGSRPPETPRPSNFPEAPGDDPGVEPARLRAAKADRFTDDRSRSGQPAGAAPWQGTPLPAGRSASRWKADAATLADAARFAVWGDPSESATGPPSFATI